LGSSTSPIATRRLMGAAGEDFRSIATTLRSTTITTVLFLTDCLAAAGSVFTIWYLAKRLDYSLTAVPLGDQRLPILGLAAPLAVIISYFIGKGRYTSRDCLWSELRVLVSAGLAASTFEIVIEALTAKGLGSLAAIAGIALFLVCAWIGSRLARYLLAHLGLWLLPAAIIGEPDRAGETQSAIVGNVSLGYKIVASIDPASLLSSPDDLRLQALLTRYQAKFLLVACADPQWQRAIVEAALREQIPFALAIAPSFSCRAISLFGRNITLLVNGNRLAQPIARLAKALFDLAMASLILFVASPVLLAIALLVRLDGGPAFYAHRRVGIGGRHFHCLKFRTMAVDAEQRLQKLLSENPDLANQWHQQQKLDHDPRITRLGKFLRQTSLDELPQLINVAKLEMSLVGPRPIVDAETIHYREHIAEYYLTRPGLTGLWQASGRSDTTYSQRVGLDVWYVNNWTLWHDIVVLLKTVPAVLKRRGAR
jgi:Undecaprenyl-phosphate galactose phosphotransferase WbaP